MKINLFRRYFHIQDNVSNLLELQPVSEYYSALLNNLMKEKSEKSVKFTEAQISAAFIILMSYLVKHQEEAENVLQGRLLVGLGIF